MESFYLLLAIGATCLLSSLPEAIACDLPYSDIGGKCLFVDPLEADTWYNMRFFCKTLGTTGGELVKIDSANLLADIIDYIEEFDLNQSHYWIGANDENYETHFRWNDDTTVPKGSPFWRYECDQSLTQRPMADTAKNCAALDKNAHYLFADFPCMGDGSGVPFSPICQAN